MCRPTIRINSVCMELGNLILFVLKKIASNTPSQKKKPLLFKLPLIKAKGGKIVYICTVQCIKLVYSEVVSNPTILINTYVMRYTLTLMTAMPISLFSPTTSVLPCQIKYWQTTNQMNQQFYSFCRHSFC